MPLFGRHVLVNEIIEVQNDMRRYFTKKTSNDAYNDAYFKAERAVDKLVASLMKM